MIGMGFGFFLVNLLIALVVATVLHFALEVRVRGGTLSYLSSLVLAWLGAWLGPPVFGNWFPGLETAGVHWIPALLGSCALLILAVDAVKTCQTRGEEEVAETAGSEGGRRRFDGPLRLPLRRLRREVRGRGGRLAGRLRAGLRAR